MFFFGVLHQHSCSPPRCLIWNNITITHRKHLHWSENMFMEQLLVTVTVTQVKYLSHYSSDLSDYAVTLTNYSITADNSISIWDLKIQHSSIRTSLSPRTIMAFTQKRTERALNVECFHSPIQILVGRTASQMCVNMSLIIQTHALFVHGGDSKGFIHPLFLTLL